VSVHNLPTPLNSVAVAPDGEVVTAGADGKVYFLSPQGEMRGELLASATPIIEVAISPDGALVAAVGIRGSVAVIERNITQLADELTSHLAKEETILFPYIETLVRSQQGGDAPNAGFGTVESPIRMMMMEHEGAAALLEEMRAATNGFTPWEGACPTSTGLYYGIAEFERDLHRHVHLENNLLFPRAIELERQTLAAR